MSDIDIVRLSVPGALPYRDVVLRAVASFCRLRRDSPSTKQEASRDVVDPEFDDKVVSAVSEAFNNVAIHGYRGQTPGKVDVELAMFSDRIRVRLYDTGKIFDPAGFPPPRTASLPENHMGLYIIHSCMDSVSYQRGQPPEIPNVLTLTKRYRPPEGEAQKR
jgi:serine/threonine-protein kinase RsbW